MGKLVIVLKISKIQIIKSANQKYAYTTIAGINNNEYLGIHELNSFFALSGRQLQSEYKQLCALFVELAWQHISLVVVGVFVYSFQFKIVNLQTELHIYGYF